MSRRVGDLCRTFVVGWGVDIAVCGKRKRGLNMGLILFSVVSPGFEPRQTVPKTVVLPLHHETIVLLCFEAAVLFLNCEAKVRLFLKPAKLCGTFFELFFTLLSASGCSVFIISG